MRSERGKVLVVDDDPAMCRLIRGTLAKQYDVADAECGESALSLAAVFAPQLVLLDITMPGLDGFETCRRIKQRSQFAALQVIMVSSHSSLSDRQHAMEAGADDYVTKPIDVYVLRSRVDLHFRLYEALRRLESIEGQHSASQETAAKLGRELTAVQHAAVLALAKVGESRDEETGEHQVRIRAYCRLLAQRLRADSPYADRINEQFLNDLYESSPLHDIGKVGIADAILLKPGRLTASEFEAMKLHTIIGANALDRATGSNGGNSFLAMAATIARFHHERFDGSGYLAGLRGEEIPLPARIVAVADVYDALTSVRPYKDAIDPLVARDMILEQSGRHFDPVIVAAFRHSFEKFLRIREDRTLLAEGATAFLAQRASLWPAGAPAMPAGEISTLMGNAPLDR
jgi:putative two-component system response regulator